MRTRRTEPPPRTPEEREAARAERERRRAARRGETAAPGVPGFEPDLAVEAQIESLAVEMPTPGRRARNTAIFSVLTGLSRVAGLGREIVARSYFGTSGAMSAFTLAFQVPNLIRALVADAALSSAFVPVFSELLETKRRREAFQLAAALAGLLLVALTLITIVFILLAPAIVPLFTGDEST